MPSGAGVSESPVGIVAAHPFDGVGPAGFQQAYMLYRVPRNPEEVQSAHAMFTEGLKNVAAGANAAELKRGMDRGSRAAVEALKAMSRPVESRKECPLRFLDFRPVMNVAVQNHLAVVRVDADPPRFQLSATAERIEDATLDV